MKALAPGLILQLMYLRARLRRLPSGRFIEVGPGAGEVTQLLLSQGWHGCSYELDPISARRLRERFARPIAEGRYRVLCGDYIDACEPGDNADLVVSCMVMEHLDDVAERAFLARSAAALRNGGRMITIVPGSPEHWGIEDDIAGHFRRYTRDGIRALMRDNGWTLWTLDGLTYPLSNALLPMSNRLVARSEGSMLDADKTDRTKASGRRSVRFKTDFPAVLGWLLNPVTMYPLFLLQRIFRNARGALVLCFEATPHSSPTTALGRARAVDDTATP